MKSGSLNLLEPSGPHRACYGTALSLMAGFVIKEHDLIDIYKANGTDLQPSKILTFYGDPLHDGTRPNNVLQFSLHVMLMVAIKCHHF